MKTWEVAQTMMALLLAAALLLWAGVADAQTLVRTGQMWGADKSEGKVDAVLGIAGECVQTDNKLVCQFVSMSLSADEKCSVIVSTWTERLRRVSRTHEEFRWAGTKGPDGAAGVLTATVLVAKPSELLNEGKTDYFNAPGATPDPGDKWSYSSTQVFTSLVLGKKMPPTITEVASHTDQQESPARAVAGSGGACWAGRGRMVCADWPK